MIKAIKIEKKWLHFREPFTIAYEKVTKAPILLLTLSDGNGHIGIGSAAPDEEVTGENIDQLLEVMQEKLSCNFFSEPIEKLEFYKKAISKGFKNYPSAQAAVETAVRHLAALQQNKDPRDYFKKNRESCPLVVTVGIKAVDDTLKEIKSRVEDGCYTIKLKCGLSYIEDIDKIKIVRKFLPSDVKLIIDANQGYTFSEAKTVVKAISGLDIAALEQPVRAREKESFKNLKEMGVVPLLADEMAGTRDEALELLESDYMDGINVKMMKYGGASTCQEIIEKALKLSKKVMIGCMYESNVSITAAAYLALAYPVDFVDLDSGHFDFDDDPVLGGAVVRHGSLQIESIPYLRT